MNLLSLLIHEIIEMSHASEYPAIVQRGSEGSFLVSFPDLPEALTFGRTEADAAKQAVDCLREALRGRMRDNEEIPAPSKLAKDAIMVPVPATLAAKLAVYEAFWRKGMSKVDLASKLNINESEVRRILNPMHGTKLDRLEEAAAALGGRLEVNFVPFS